MREKCGGRNEHPEPQHAEKRCGYNRRQSRRNEGSEDTAAAKYHTKEEQQHVTAGAVATSGTETNSQTA